MVEKDTGFDAAYRRLIEQEERLARQERLITGMRAAGLPTEGAEQVLAVMRMTLATLHACVRQHPGS